MKKLLLLVIASMFVFGCASLKDPEYMKRDTIYASSAHMSYSIWGYLNPDAKWQKLSDEQEWWGIEIPYIPAR
ncbi:MAG: hypothetical protein ACXACF_07475 [Candidatus Hermodarchaeia archaeon]|jgi:hypothetical protein